MFWFAKQGSQQHVAAQFLLVQQQLCITVLDFSVKKTILYPRACLYMGRKRRRVKGETWIVFLFHFWRMATTDIENTEGPVFCTFWREFWKGVVRGEREGKVPVALNLTRKLWRDCTKRSLDITDIIHATLFHLLQRLTEFLEGVRLEGGHVNPVTVGETSCDSEAMGWFCGKGCNLQSISYRRASVELLTLNITRPILSSKLETCDTEVISQLKGKGWGTQERKNVCVRRRRKPTTLCNNHFSQTGLQQEI